MKKRKLTSTIKLTILSIVLTLTAVNAFAQSPCVPCTPTKTREVFTYVKTCEITPTCPGTLIDNVCDCSNPTEWVEIYYYLIVCGNDVGVLFDQAVIHNGYVFTPTDYKNLQQVLINKYNPTGVFSFMYSEGCQAMAEVKYPAGTKCYSLVPEGPNAGQLVMYDYDKDRTVQTIACPGSDCCKLDYVFDANTKSYHLQNISGGGACTSPTPNITTSSISCKDINGNPVTYTGQVNFISGCETYCDESINTVYKTNNTKTFEPFAEQLNFSVLPTPANESITFNSTKQIGKIEIYDVAGKKLMAQNNFDNNTINISTLPKGIHVVRVYFTNNIIKSIKIVKE
jgi:hypothetical protein